MCAMIKVSIIYLWNNFFGVFFFLSTRATISVSRHEAPDDNNSPCGRFVIVERSYFPCGNHGVAWVICVKFV